jgi:hypothetical protein
METNNERFNVCMFREEQFKNFLGKLLTQIEILGLSEKQEKAYKDITRQLVWNLWEHPWGIDSKMEELPRGDVYSQGEVYIDGSKM